jgi:hypothetical protein
MVLYFEKGMKIHAITEFLVRNASLYGDEVSLIEVNPELEEKRAITWREYELIEPNPIAMYRREITWREFDNQPINLPICF